MLNILERDSSLDNTRVAMSLLYIYFFFQQFLQLSYRVRVTNTLVAVKFDGKYDGDSINRSRKNRHGIYIYIDGDVTRNQSRNSRERADVTLFAREKERDLRVDARKAYNELE